MDLTFEPISLEKQQAYRKKLSRCSRIASDYSFVNLWGWGPEYGLQWAWDGNLVWLRQQKPRPALWAPVGDWLDVDWESALKTAHIFSDRMIRVPAELAEMVGNVIAGKLEITESREHWDYLHHAAELAELKGNRYHKKKNLVNRFVNTYSFKYLNLEGSMVEKVLGMQQDWCVWRDCESSETLAAENKAIARVLREWRNLEGVAGGAIVVDDVIAAYTVAETLPDNTLVIHFEKANQNYQGSYQTINQQFLIHSGKGHTLVNREQDLGNEGLRKAKLSYHPVDFIKKYQINWLPDLTAG